jgi:AcrR family transcriptional regulator
MNKKTYHHGNLREALIEAAQHTLATEGVEGLSLRKVAQQAGVSATALYSHFKDKRELLALLATQGFAQLSAAMASEAQARPGASDAADFSLTGLAMGYIKFSMGNTALFQLMFGKEVGNLLDFPELVAAGSQSYGMMADCVAAQVKTGNASTTPAVAATAAWSMVHGLATLINDGRVSADTCGVSCNEEMILQVCQTLVFTR